ncbi:MAG: hypothetical protein LBK73_14935 [Treponema sp.]|nr:hypothetical protein [Treponema sp.]
MKRGVFDRAGTPAETPLDKWERTRRRGIQRKRRRNVKETPFTTPLKADVLS